MPHIVQWLIPVSNKKTRPGTKRTPRTITIHETDNTNRGANAQAHARLQEAGNFRQASWHFQVDDKDVIYQSVPENEVAYAGGDGRGPGNSFSIHIEICVNSDGNFNKAVANAIWLVQYLMKKYNISIHNVVQHNKWSGKNCPRNLRNGAKGITWTQLIKSVQTQGTLTPPTTRQVLKYGDVGLDVLEVQKAYVKAGYPLVLDSSFGPATEKAVKAFQSAHGLVVDGIHGPATSAKLNAVIAALDKSVAEAPQKEGVLSVNQYNELKKKIEELEKKLGTGRDVSSAFLEDWNWAAGKGLLNGNRPSHPVTREQMAAVLHRYNQSNSLTDTAKDDLKDLLKKAYDNKTLLVDHSEKVETMPEHQIINLLVSVASRTFEANEDK